MKNVLNILQKCIVVYCVTFIPLLLQYIKRDFRKAPVAHILRIHFSESDCSTELGKQTTH